MFNVDDIKKLREMTGAGMLDCKKALETSKGDVEDAVDWLREKGISSAAKKESRIAAEGLTEVLVDGNRAVILEVNSETDFVARNEHFVNFVKSVANTLLKADPKTLEEALELKIDDLSISDALVNLISQLGEKMSFRRFELVEKNDDEVFGSYIHMGGKISALTVLKAANEEVARDVSMHVAAMNPLYLNRDSVPEAELNREKDIIKEQAINEGKPADIAEKMVAGRINKFYKDNCLIEQDFVKDPDLNVETYVKNNSGEIVSYIRYEVGEGMEKRNEDFADEVMSQINN